MALNLSRNTRVWFTTNVNPNTGVLPDATTGYSSFTAANTYEIQVLDGYSFSQGTGNQVITLNEAGNTPNRGQRSFNTQLNPVDLSFSTYIRPRLATNVTAIEKVLWNALTGSKDIDTSVGITATSITRATTLVPTVTIVSAASMASFVVGDALNITGATGTGAADWNSPAIVASAQTGAGPYTLTAVMAKAPATTAGLSPAGGTLKLFTGQWAENTTHAYTSFVGSNKNQLQKFALIFQVDSAIYIIDNCALNQATIDFGLDAISMIAWTGFGTAVKRAATLTTANLSSATAYSTAANYITNKLSSTTLISNIGGAGGTTYNVPLTGGSITINNNINYVTPSNLGVVNTPIGYYTGTRSITGSINAYLKTGTAGDAGQLLSDILTTSASAPETKFKLQVEIGGSINANRVELDIPGASLNVPSIDIADVVSTTINFTAQGSDAVLSTNTYDITNTNDMTVRYYSA
jgi:hypothetical protein